jgi:hypothetical protein
MVPVRKVTILFAVGGAISLTAFAVIHSRTGLATDAGSQQLSPANLEPLPALDARSITGVKTLTKTELLNLMTKRRPLTLSEKASIDRGCPGLACLYQGLGLTKWPESARGTRAYLSLQDALNRTCPKSGENFVFIKQAWWTSGKPPTADPATGEVPLSSVTRMKPGWYTFNYAVHFPTTKTYAWINHREYGFPANLLWPMKAYLSLSPPPLDDNRPAQLYCSTCK